VLIVALLCRKFIKKYLKKSDKIGNLKGSVDLKAMPLLGNSFKEKVRIEKKIYVFFLKISIINKIGTT